MEKEYNILLIESTGTTCSVSLAINNKLAGEYNLYGSNLHDKMLAENLRRLLQDTNFEIDNIDAVALSAGPGSFTGLRIGAALAKGLCFDGHPAFISIPTINALADNAIDYISGDIEEIIPTIKVHKDILYYARFAPDGRPLTDIIQSTVDELNDNISDKSLICGTAALYITKGTVLPGLTGISSNMFLRPAIKKLRTGAIDDSAEFTPLYVQEFELKTSRKPLNPFSEKK